MRAVAPEHIPAGVGIKWNGPGNDRFIDALHFQGGIFEINHQLPRDVETMTLLRTVGVTAKAVAQAAELNIASISKRTETVCRAFGVERRPKHPTMPALVGRLCLPGSVLRQTRPISIENEPDSICLKILGSLGEGNDWAEAAALMQKTTKSIAWHVSQNYCPEFTQNQGLRVAPMLLHAYGSGLLSPEDVVSRQEGVYPHLPVTRGAYYSSWITRPT